ncbi:hypothetical protein, partial [Burkholderia territorii]|uniref:hypothetical protein n=1 Tax=Burkholderia territorii TaxID=1503055 RepID=UPI001E4E0C68
FTQIDSFGLPCNYSTCLEHGNPDTPDLNHGPNFSGSSLSIPALRSRIAASSSKRNHANLDPDLQTRIQPAPVHPLSTTACHTSLMIAPFRFDVSQFSDATSCLL